MAVSSMYSRMIKDSLVSHVVEIIQYNQMINTFDLLGNEKVLFDHS